MNTPPEIETLFSNLANTTIVTPNRRLATYLKKEHTDFCKCSANCWETPDILPLSGWLQRLWAQLEDHGQATHLLLSPLQEWALWKEIFHSKLEEQPIDVKNMVRTTQDAWKTIKRWEVSYTHPDFLQKDDTAFFASCASRFSKTCEQNGWLSEGSLCEVLFQNIKAENLPARFVLFEFDEIYPELHSLIKKLKSLGVLVMEYRATKKCTTPIRVAAPQTESEITLAARFALYHHLANKEDSIAVVVPELNQNWLKINTIFKQVFQSNLALSKPVSFSISAGEPLPQFPLIRGALLLLQLVQATLSTNELIELVRSPHLVIAEIPLTSIDDFVSTIIESKRNHWTLSDLPLSLYKQPVQRVNGCLSCFEWAEQVYLCLETLKWGGVRTLESEEYQSVNAFKSALEEILQLDAVLNKPLNWKAYYQFLTHVLETTIFQPKSEDAKVQVLGILEARGRQFDKVWITGLSQDAWPPKHRPNPFIPLSLQREFLMPHASPQRELVYAKHILEDFCGSAEEIILSWPAMESDRSLLPSSLITAYKVIDLTEIPQAPFREPQFDLFERYAHELEIFEDAHTLPVSEKVLHGGMSLLKDISACPFKAFTRHRLNAKALNSQTLELTPQEKGTLLHAILESVWRELKDSEALKRCNDLTTLVESGVENAFLLYENLFKKRQTYRLLEKERLSELVKKWLLFEKERPAFSVVALEKEQTFSLGGVDINLRVDRIDEIENGDWILLDYKSGITSLYDWFGERPMAPQLPLYALANPKVKAIAFAEISARAIKLVGVSNVQTGIEGVLNFSDCVFRDASDWFSQLDFWKKTFEGMIYQFKSGVASVSPAEKSTCQTCDFMSFCRNYENLR